MTEATQNQEPTQNSETKEDPQIQLNDLIFVLQIIQLASSRAAFRVEEYSSVGACYERIFNFLVANGAIKPTGNAMGAPMTAPAAGMPTAQATPSGVQ